MCVKEPYGATTFRTKRKFNMVPYLGSQRKLDNLFRNITRITFAVNMCHGTYNKIKSAHLQHSMSFLELSRNC